MLKVSGKGDKEKYTPDELTSISLEEVKKMIELQIPNAFAKKAPAKKAAAKTATKAKPKKK